MTRLKALCASTRAWVAHHIIESILIGTLAVLLFFWFVKGSH